MEVFVPLTWKRQRDYCKLGDHSLREIEQLRSNPTAIGGGIGVFQLDSSYIDKSLPIPVGTQLRGLLVNMIAHGGLPPGSRLPSVRELASDLGVAIMNVSQVYQQLSSLGLIEIRRGLGAFTLQDQQKNLENVGPFSALRDDIERLLTKASEHGVTATDLVTLVSTQAQLRAGTGLRLAFVGPFPRTIERYVEALRPRLHPDDRIEVYSLAEVAGDHTLRDSLTGASLVLTIANREPEVRALLPKANVFAVRLVISAETKSALHALDADARIVAVASVQDYIATLRPGIHEIAPALHDIKITEMQAPDLARQLIDRDVIVYWSGAEAVIEMAPGLKVIEYRHAPDSAEVGRVLVPLLLGLRRRKQNSQL